MSDRAARVGANDPFSDRQAATGQEFNGGAGLRDAKVEMYPVLTRDGREYVIRDAATHRPMFGTPNHADAQLVVRCINAVAHAHKAAVADCVDRLFLGVERVAVANGVSFPVQTQRLLRQALAREVKLACIREGMLRAESR